MSSYLDYANDPVLWLMSLPLVLIVGALAITYSRRAKKVGSLVDLSSEEQVKAFRTGAISAIGPALGVFVVMLGLMSKIGGPLAWQRLSIIGAAHTELTAAEMAAQAMGTTLDSPDYNLVNYANACWVMALNGCGWLLVVALLTDKLDAISYKLTKGDTSITSVISVSGMCGAMGYLAVSNAMPSIENAVAAVIAGIAMILLNQLGKKIPILMEFNLGFALIIGMIAGTIARS
ncbi:MAG: DUF5058 family protein [Peptoniphilus sp.]|nr:DUF5058 family protein [Peptoniphilus sp.]MDD7363054.1 DUF5058 family protein [Bacillota bacterium]MDY6045319.1 DUF5058 family protein [Peptoniphilus sp.]